MGQLPSNTNQLSALQQSLFVVQKLKSQLAEIEQAKTEPIAIVGMSCRFPGGANDPDAFWQLLHDGVDAITEVPAQRWSIDAYYDPNKDAPGKMYTRSAGFLQQIDQFDPEFFGISAREALSMDPQQRLLLEVSWEALENAGQAPKQLSGSQTGIFVGIGQNDYANLQMKFGEPTQISAYTGTGNGFCFASGRLSYVLGLQGPNMAIDTACSSSLVAVHLACQSLRAGECNLALAGGVQLILSPEVAIFLSKAHALSPDGRCKTFDAAADGFGRGEGCGVVVLKRLSDAVADKNQILAVIRGSATNHDGPSSGLTVPNGLAQQKLLRDALKNSQVEPSQVSYVETHGTGTALGDPIEVEGLGTVFGKGRSQNHPLMISSVKTNLGHLEAAAGIAGLIKVVLALQHEEIPPHLHFKQPNPYISWHELPVVVPTEPTPWHKEQRPRLAGVSSFGISGTNAHVVLEEAPFSPHSVPAEKERPLHMLTLSAKTPEALVQLVSRYEQHLANCAPDALSDICFTANSGRSHFQHRLSVVAASTDIARAKLAVTVGQEAQGVFQGQVSATTQPKVAFLFTGQGSQYVDMGRQLYETQPTFRQALERCDQILRPYLEKPLLSVLYPATADTFSLDETAYTQPALFALEYALVQLWKSWGITPNVVMGHSVGEYVAACVAGVFSLEDGLKLIATRGRLMQALPQDGEMVAVMADPLAVATALKSYTLQVAIAAVNGPESLVISGERQAVRAICADLEAQGMKTKPLQVSHAFHSPLMQPMLEKFRQVVSEVTFSPPQLKLASNLTGQLVSKEIATPEYWCQHILNPVQFAASLKTLEQQGYEVFVEIGPKPTLLGMGRQCLSDETPVQGRSWLTPVPSTGGTPARAWLPSLRLGQPDWQSMLESLAQLYLRGVSVDWNGFDQDYPRRRVKLPTYPFQRQRYWVENSKNGQAKTEFLSSQDVQTPIAHFLYQGDTQQLVRYVESAAVFSAEEIKLLPKLLEVLVKQHKSKSTAAEDWLYKVEWQQEPRQVAEISFAQPGSWLILADKRGVGQALAALLQEHGQTCLMVYPGDSYQTKAAGTWSVNPSHPADFQRLIQEVIANRLPFKGVVHLWSQDAELAPDLSIPALEQTQVLGCGTTLHLVQALVNHYQQALPKLWLVTRGAVPVTAAVPGVAQSPLWGLGKVMALEHPELWGGLIDLAPEPAVNAANHLWAELMDAQGEDQIAFRDGQRYVARLVRSQLPVAPMSLQSECTYLITGGLGALGLKVGQWMVEQGVRHLVLTGRNEASASVQAAIASMQQAGVQVLVARADVAKQQDMVRTLEQVKASMPPLRGIVHAAGVLDDGILLQQDWGRFAKVMAPKVNGTWNLHVLTQEMPLDFFVTFSSTSALLGSPGQGNYAAANAFMDALAHYRSHLGLPGLSINWGPWSDAGMAASLASHNQARLAVQGMQSIPLEQGLSVLKQLLGSTLHIGVLPVDWSVLRQQLGAGRQLPLLSQLLAEVKPQAESEQMLAKQKQHELLQSFEAAPVGNRHSLLVRHIQSEVAKVLMCDASRLPDPQQGLFDMGMDSLMAVELKNRLDISLGCSLPTTLVFESPTIKAVAEHVARKVLGWNSPETDNGKLNKGEEERALALSEVKQLAEDEVEASIAQELAGLESLLKGN